MSSTNFMIGPIKDGLRKDIKPYALTEDAFAILLNAYQWRGRIVRRSGYTLLGRLSNNTPVMGLRTRELFGLGLQQLIAFDTTLAYEFNTGTLTFIPLPSVMTVVWSGTDYQFFFTTNYAGAFWATNSKPGLNGIAISAINNANPAQVTTTINHGFTTGQSVTIINVSGYLPLLAATPPLNGKVFTITVTGLNTFTLDGFNGALYGAYVSGGIALNSEVAITGQDGIRYYGALTNGTGWANYNPPIDSNNALMGALLIFPYRGYLVFLNTTEGNETGSFNFGNRARWTQIGTPYYSEPVPTTPNPQTPDPKAVRDDLFGRGGANDAPTQEVIIGAAFIRDVLVVYFERSTWRLRFVNNAQNPFVWERINVELGASSTFSTIPFDKGVMGIGNRGIVISDGNDAIRFDEKIPDDIFDIRQSNNGFERVYGIRTFRTRLNYWTIPSASNLLGKFPDQVLVFNYETKNWSYFDDCFTCFGYYYPETSDLGERWMDLDQPWPNYDDKNCEVGTSHSGLETVIAGNQQGFVFKLEQKNYQNEPSLFIQAIAANIITSPDHNLSDKTWISLSNVNGTTSADGESLNQRNFQISYLSANTLSLNEFEPINAGLANGATFGTTLNPYFINFVPILRGSVRIYVGTIIFTDSAADGILTSNVVGTVGTINYLTGSLILSFSPPLGAPTQVDIYVVAVDEEQILVPVNLIGVYVPGGLITKISNIDIQSKIFNFFKEDAGTRLSKIDFYTNLTANGQFQVNVLGDSSNLPINTPRPDNLQSNVVLTTKNPYQVGSGSETIYRLFCDATSQTVQIQLNLSDKQMAVSAINDQNIEIVAMMFTIRDKGRLV